jgi:hypothetical protein
MLTMRYIRSAALLVASLAASACGGGQNQENTATNAANAAQQQVVPKLPVPAPEQPLAREQLLLAAEHAASDFAAGTDDAQRQKDLTDKKFEFRIRFGCEGPSDHSEGPFDWSVNKRTGALKVRATPTLSTNDASVKALAGEAFEAVEGFWVRRPWLLSASCPKTAPPTDQAQATADTKATQHKKPASAAKDDKPAAASAPPAPLLGIAQFFTATDPRTLRRSGRAYEATKALDTGDVPSGGFDLVVTGRLVALPDGRVIACTHPAAGERPSCVISVQFGKVSIERADTHEQLAQWGSG